MDNLNTHYCEAVIRRGDFASPVDLAAKIERFIGLLQCHDGETVSLELPG